MTLTIIVEPKAKYEARAKKDRAVQWYGMPGAYKLGKYVYCPTSTAKAALAKRGWQRTLLVHEWHHLEDGMVQHPQNPFGAIIEAFKYKFDERCFTRFLRWRKSSKFIDGERWVKGQLAMALSG